MSDITERATAKDWVNRAFTVDDIEIRSEGDGLTFDGVASVVDTPYVGARHVRGVHRDDRAGRVQPHPQAA
jgi:hypothetical protein